MEAEGAEVSAVRAYTGNDPQLMDDSAAIALDERIEAELPYEINALCNTVDHLHYYFGSEPISKAAILASLSGDDCEAGRLLGPYLMRCGSGDDAMKDCALELRRKYEKETGDDAHYARFSGRDDELRI